MILLGLFQSYTINNSVWLIDWEHEAIPSAEDEISEEGGRYLVWFLTSDVALNIYTVYISEIRKFYFDYAAEYCAY